MPDKMMLDTKSNIHLLSGTGQQGSALRTRSFGMEGEAGFFIGGRGKFSKDQKASGLGWCGFQSSESSHGTIWRYFKEF